ncbi:MAG: polysaccharide deacetylase family protein [Eubacteriales bacterium]|nr:polysaccharide deacetylase family protein [Eubacteriales bacterium]
MKKKTISILLSALCAAFLLSGCGLLPFQDDVPFKEDEKPKAEAVTPTAVPEPEPTEEPEPEPEADTPGEDMQQGDKTPLEQASFKAVQYDYDGAIELLKSQPDYESNEDMKAAVAEYENTKATCVEYPLEQITHVFYHTLIKDTSKAFDGDAHEAGYNQVMTTIDEFNKITQSMYDKGYVLVSPHDMAIVNEDGSMSRGKIMLPPGKIPFVLSQDDVSYYHYMDGDGFANKLVLDQNGEVKCEYIEDDGSVSIGDYDMVPLLNTFIKEHPDFSYHGRKGILAMTGYNGVFGYRTDIAYKTGENLQDDQKQFLDSHPDFNFEQEVQQATAVADAMKADGWEFASHTWGHRNATDSSAEQLQTDNERWEANVAPILGSTDMIIFAFGADIGNWEGYTMDNPKFAYYKSRGYDYYCNVDSNQYWVQITDQYFRQGRRNLDGYRMYYNPEMLSDLFDVSAVWDSSRPEPVPPM